MKFLSITRLSFLVVLLVFSTSLTAQTERQTQKIKQSYNLSKLNDLQLELKQKSTKERVQALQMAKLKGWPIIIEKNGTYAELQKVTADGNPIYYTTFNVDAANSTRANYLNNGGGLGLNLDGQNMTAHVWDAGLARSTHQEYDGAGGNNRFSIGDGTTELHFHSAHVTGTIIASGVQANAKGMAPQANAIGYNWSQDAAEATTAASNGMLISNHSYGFIASGVPDQWFGAYRSHARDWDQIMYNTPYYLMLVAAGNEGNDNSSNGAPLDGNSSYDKLTGHSTAKNNMVVANGQDANIDANGNLTSVTINSGSSEGPTDDYRIKPDITGNGTLLYSTYEHSDVAYQSITGTSMASPNVAGTLLLLQQHYNNENGSFMLAATLKGLALHTADDAGPLGPDAVYGWGLLNAKAAAEAITNNGNESVIRELTLSSGQTYTTTVNADGINNLIASISWTDPAGTENSGTNSNTPALVNDLDIRVSNSTTYFPYKLTSITTNSKADNIVDPFERVDVANASGTFTITVTHKGTLNSNQNFSLIITGVSSSVSCTPTTPTALTVSNVSASSAQVSWNSVAGTTYDIRYKTLSGTTWTTTTVSSTSTTLSGLTDGTQYEVQVRSKCPDGSTSNYSASVSFTTTAVCTPTTPTGLATSNVSASSAQVTWNSVAGTTYDVRYKTLSGSTWTTIAVSSTSTTLNGLTAETQYEVQVRSKCPDGTTSNYSASVNFTTTAVCTPTTPTGLATSNVSASSAQVSWNSVAGTTYDIRYKTLSGTTWTTATVSSTSTTLSGLTSGTQYEVQVRSKCPDGTTSNYSASVSFTTTAVCTPTTPTGLATSNVSASSAQVSWNSVAGTTYDIRYKTLSGTTWTTIAVSSTSTTLNGLTAETQYEVQVRSKCPDGTTSNYSASVNFTTTVVQLNYCNSQGNSSNDEYIQRVQLNTINNASGAATGYTDFTAISTDLTQGTAYTITITPKWVSTIFIEAYAVWIDYNHDGDFTDSGELVWSKSASTDTQVSGTFTVPSSSSQTATRMRVSMKYNGIPASCESFPFGEVEDYTVNITESNATPPNCATVVSPVGGATDVAISTDLEWTSVTDADGYKLYFGKNNPPTDIANAVDLGNVTTYNPSDNLDNSTTYYWRIVPYNTGGDASGCATNSFTTIADAACTYCTMNYSYPQYLYISKVAFNGINNSSSHSNFSDYTSISTDVEQGKVYSISVDATVDGAWVEHVFVWFDWNGNCSFDDAGEVYDLGQTPAVKGTHTLTANITVPSNAVLGTTRMRVAGHYNSNPTSCQNANYGEGEDYSLNIIEGGITTPPNCASVVSPVGGATNVAISTNLEWTSVSDANGYKLYFGKNNPPTDIANAVDLGNVTTYNPTSDLDNNTTYYWRIVPYNTGGDASGCATNSFTTIADAACTYCTMNYSTPQYIYISKVVFNGINNSSSHSNFSDYTSISTDVEQGKVYSISVDATVEGAWVEHVFAWFDWNGNCSFDDAGEAYDLGQAPAVQGTHTLTANITVPSNAVLGTTRMRVAGHYNSNPTSCQNAEHGEGEDYTINISDASKGIQNSDGINGIDSYIDDRINIFPNPTHNKLTISTTSEFDKILIYNFMGALVLEYKFSGNNQSIDVSALKSGYYVIRFTSDDAWGVTKKFIKQ